MSEIDHLNYLLKRLENIAKENDKRFIYKLEIEFLGDIREYYFTCHCRYDPREGDAYIFLAGAGASLEEAVNDALNCIEDTCVACGFSLPYRN